MKNKEIPDLAVPTCFIEYTRHLLQLVTFHLQEFYLVFHHISFVQDILHERLAEVFGDL